MAIMNRNPGAAPEGSHSGKGHAMRKKLALLTVMALATAAAILSHPYKAEAAFCNPSCCGGDSCSCCTRTCQCPIPGWTAK